MVPKQRPSRAWHVGKAPGESGASCYQCANSPLLGREATERMTHRGTAGTFGHRTRNSEWQEGGRREEQHKEEKKDNNIRRNGRNNKVAEGVFLFMVGML